MKAITVYESTDGSRWDLKSQAMARDVLNYYVQAIERTLPPVPLGRTRKEVSIDRVKKAKRDVVAICREQFPDEKVFQHEPAEDIHPMSYTGRFLDDIGGPLARIWRWFQCERDGWLYSQPYYADSENTEAFEEVRS